MRPVAVTKEGGFALIRPPYLGKQLWPEYLRAVEGARYDKAKGASVATIDKVPGILRRLRELDLRVECSSDLVTALAEHDARLWLDVQSTKERIARFDDELRKSGKALFPFQATGAVWLAPKGGALLADEQGLGKTLQVIAAIPPNTPVLVVCPAYVKAVWRGEIAKFRPGLKAVVLEGRKAFRWPTAGEVLIVNYEILPDAHSPVCLEHRRDKTTKVEGRHTEECEGMRNSPVPHQLSLLCTGCFPRYKVARDCKGCVPFLKAVPDHIVVVADEAHMLKNGNAQRTVRFRGLSHAAREVEGKVWLGTGTPLLNQPMELWSVLEAAQLASGVFGTFKGFLKVMGGKEEEHGFSFDLADVESAEARERLERWMLRRLKKDVLSQLPDLMVQDVEVEVDPKIMSQCDAVVKAAGGVDKIVADLDKSLSFKNMSQVDAALARAKIPAMLEIVESYETSGEPLVVFSAHRDPIDALEGREGWATITGDTPQERRADIVAAFQAGRLKGVAGTIQAMGTGITLTYASNELFVDEVWSPAINAQARDRLHRIGQKNAVLCKRLVANHELDKRRAEALERKTKLIKATVDHDTEQPEEGAA